MAINILEANHKNDHGLDAVSVEIANGDLRVLNEIVDAYGVNDITDIIAFAIAVMKEANGRPIASMNQDGTMRKFMPSDSIKKNDKRSREKV